MRTVHLIIKGKVQGVFFRASAQEVALQLKVKGWIRNTEQRNVEVMVTGDKTAVQQFINWCWQGPLRAEVTEVIVTERHAEDFDTFRVVRG